MKSILLALCFVVNLTAFAAADTRDSFYAANKAYAEGRYDEARNAYQELIEREGWSAEVLYNLGNAYHELKDTGHAILNYKRSLYLAPRNRDTQANLGSTLKDAGIFLDEGSRITNLFRSLSINEWTYLLCLAFAVVSLLALWRSAWLLIALRQGRALPPRTISGNFVIYLFVMLLALSVLGILFHNGSLAEAVVTQKNAQLLISPFEGASRIMSLREGQVVTANQTYEDFVFVHEPSGQAGWVSKKTIEKVVP